MRSTCAAAAHSVSGAPREEAPGRTVDGATLASCVYTSSLRTSARANVAGCHRRMGFQRDGMLFAADVLPPLHASPSWSSLRAATMGSHDGSPLLAHVVLACTYDLASRTDHRVPRAYSCGIRTPVGASRRDGERASRGDSPQSRAPASMQYVHALTINHDACPQSAASPLHARRDEPPKSPTSRVGTRPRPHPVAEPMSRRWRLVHGVSFRRTTSSVILP